MRRADLYTKGLADEVVVVEQSKAVLKYSPSLDHRRAHDTKTFK